MKEKKVKYPPKELHLVLKHKWYDMIESDEKRQEYRDIKTWGRRLCTFGHTKYCQGECIGCKMLIDHHIMHTTVERIVFHRGYTNTTMKRDLSLITIDRGNPDWGAPEEKVLNLWLSQSR